MSIHPSSLIDPGAEIGPGTTIGPQVVIEGPVKVGAGCQIGPGAVLLGNLELGRRCRVHSRAVLGDVPQDHKFVGETSYCRIGDDCVIREGVTIHRAVGAGRATVIGNRCYLMTNSHVAHDCVLQDEVTLVSGALLGGHVQVGRGAIISGNVGVHQYVRIGERAMIGAVAMISQDVPPYLMTDRDGKVIGLNSVGLLRAGVSLAERQELKRLFKLVYHSDMTLGQSLEIAIATAASEPGKRFVEFFQEGTARGFRKGVWRRKLAA